VADGCGVNVGNVAFGPDPNRPRSAVTGRFKWYGSGTGKGPAHEIAQRTMAEAMLPKPTPAQLTLGDDARRQKDEEGRNPPNWAVDEDLWEKAKEAAARQGHPEDWPYVVGIYQRMGGSVGNAASEDALDALAPVYEAYLYTLTEKVFNAVAAALPSF